METNYFKFTELLCSVHLSMREWLCVLLLLMPGTLAQENISLAITRFSPSEVELLCSCDHDGNMTDVFFDVFKEEYSCLHRTSEWCRATQINNCDIECRTSSDPKTLPFVVKLDGSCQEKINIQCKINNANVKPMLTLEESVKLTAQSDKPVITVNDGHSVEASCEGVPITCIVKNMCSENKVDISGAISLKHDGINYEKEGNRFTATATSHAIFKEAGTHTVTCREEGRDELYARHYTVLVHPSHNVTCLTNSQEASMPDGHFNPLSIGLLITLVSSTVVLGIVYFLFWRRWRKRLDNAEEEALKMHIHIYHPEGIKEDEEEKKPLMHHERLYHHHESLKSNGTTNFGRSSESEKEIEKAVSQLTRQNIHQYTRKILDILLKEEMTYPETGHSVIYQLIEKMDDLHKEPSYTRLIQALFPSYRKNKISEKEDLSKIIWNRLDYQSIESRTKAQECNRKLMIFLGLDAVLSFRLLWRCALDISILQKRNICIEYVLDILKLLIAEAIHFEDKSQQLSNLDPYSDTPYLQTILEAYIKKCGKQSDNGVLNFTIESVPSFVLDHVSGDVSSIKELIVKNCWEMIELNPTLCYHVDGDGKTPLHNLLETLLDDLLKGIQKVAKNGPLWNLMTPLTTAENVNVPDQDLVTPYSWILLCEESLAKVDALELTVYIEGVKKHFQEKGASREDASYGLHMLREREMEGRLKKLMNLNMWTTTGKSEMGRLMMDLERLTDLKSRGYGDCIAKLIETDQFKKFTKEHLKIRNAKSLEISADLLEVMIDECNAQKIYNIFKSHIRSSSELNYSALFDVLTMCLDKGVCPTTDEIHEISLLNVDVCTTCEAVFATVKMMEGLIGAYRIQYKTESIDLYLNPIQGQWKVSEDLRIAAGAVIREAYGTLNNCLESKSVINTLLFLRKEDGRDNIKRCFQETDAIIQGENAETLFSKWLEGEGFREMPYQGEKQVKDILIRRNDNWLKRNMLHLAAIFCHDEQVLKCIPDDVMERFVNKRDLHGCTPVHLAYLHDNQDAIMVLESYGTHVVEDHFGNIPKDLTSSSTVTSTKYMKDSKAMMTESSVFEKMKDRLVEQSILIENDLTELFQRLTKDYPLTTKIAMGESVSVKLKAGRYNKYVLQIIFKSKPYDDKPFACLRKHEELVKKMGEINMKGISLRCVAVGSPWRFIWEGEDSLKGLEISVDVVIVSVEGTGLTKQRRQGLIIDHAPGHKRHVFLKWYYFREIPSWHDTLWRHEYDILTNLSPGCRLGILISKALLESLDQTRGSIYFWKKPITTYIVQNTLLWILAGKTPGQIEKEYGNVIGARYSAHRQQLLYKENESKWMTLADLEKYAEDGRFWAEKILDAIQFVAEKYRKKLGNFLRDRCFVLADDHELMDVLETCKICLERLRPEVFFSEKYMSENMEDKSHLRTRLQEVINRLNAEASEVPGALLWKKKKEVKELKSRIENCWTKMKADLERDYKKLQTEVGKLTLEYASQEKHTLSLKKERECEMLEEKIQRFIEKIGEVNQKESLLFRLRGECEEMQRDQKSNAILKRQGKKRACDELEKEIDQLHIGCSSDLLMLEGTVSLLFNDQKEIPVADPDTMV